MADTIKTGVRGGEALLSTNVYRDIDLVLKKIKPYQTPLSSWLLLSKRKSTKVLSPYAKFEWYEQKFFPHQTKVTAAIALTGATLILTSSNVDEETIFGLKDIVLIEETNEMAYVSSVTGGGGADVILTAMDGTTSLTALTSTDYYIRIIGKRVFDYDGRTDGKEIQEVNVYNYLNEFREFIQTGGRQIAGKMYTDQLTHEDRVQQKVQEMRLIIERYFFFGRERSYKASGNNRATWGYGLDGFITTNVNTYSGALTEPVFRAHLKEVFLTGSNTKLHLCGIDQMDEIEWFMRDYYQVVQTPKELGLFEEFGCTPKTYRMFAGTVTLVWDPILDGTMTNRGYTLDEENIKLRHMNDDDKGSRKFRIRSNTQDPDVDGKETEILFDVGLQVEKETESGILYKV